MSISYLIERTLQLLLIVFIAITINFILPRLIPGDPIASTLETRIAVSGTVSVDVQKVADSYRAKFGLDQPYWRQYINYWLDILRMDLGVSLVNFPQRVDELILPALPWTMALLTTATLIAFAVGSVFGALLAWPRTPGVFHAVASPLLLLSTIPAFLLGILLVWLLAVTWRIFPTGGGNSSTLIRGLNMETLFDTFYHSLLPALALILAGLGGWAIGMRAMMISVLGEDYVTFADAKGLRPSRIFLWYGMRNALLPQVTLLALALGAVISGTVLVEAYFNYPGVGTLLFSAIAGKDYFVIQGIVLILILALAVALFVIDVIYPLLDPRIRYHR